MSSCEQFSWEVVRNSLIDEAGGVWRVEMHELSCFQVFGSIVLEGKCRVLVLPRSFVLASAQMSLPDWLYFPFLRNLLADFFGDSGRGWILDVLGPFTNRRKPLRYLVWVMNFESADDPLQMLGLLDAHFKRKRCLFLIDKRAFDATVWACFAAAGFDDMEGSRFGVCGRFFHESRRKLKVGYVGGRRF